MRKVEKVELAGGDLADLIPLISGQRAKQVWKEGNAEEAMLTIGQSVGRINDIPTVDELIKRMVKEATDTLKTTLAKIEG